MKKEDKIRTVFTQYGITECGFARFSDVLPLLECRAKARLPEQSETVIVCLFPYYVDCCPKRNLSRYAIVEDYHLVAMELLNRVCGELRALFPRTAFEAFADNSPVREVTAAVRAGLGVRGKNHLLIHPKYGSYVFIGEIVTDLRLESSAEEGHCIGCGKCIEACPGGAITETGIAQERCLSCLTQKKGSLSETDAALIKQGGLLWGCDRCQEVCPYNRKLLETPIAAFREGVIPWLDYDRIDELVKTRAFGFRGSGVLKRNYEILYGTPEQNLP